MRLALISDLHGNELAFDAVLTDAHGAFDQLVCLGDVATLGPRPGAILARLRELRCPCILGNHDEFMLNPTLIHSYSESALIVASVEATRRALSSEELAFISGFSRTLALGNVLLYHGTPRSNMEDLLTDTPAARIDEMLGVTHAVVFAGGHTHLQMVRQHGGALIVNPMKPVVERIRAIVLGADGRIEECIKWRAPTFTYRGNLASFFPKSKQHASLMFHVGARIPGDHPRLEGGGGTSRVMKVGSVAEANAAKRDIERLVRSWCDWRDSEEKKPALSPSRSAGAARAKKRATSAALSKKPRGSAGAPNRRRAG